MRYQPLDRNASDANVAAVWPSLDAALATDETASHRTTDFTSTGAASDVPAAVGGLIVAAYTALMIVFFAFFARSPVALFVIVVCSGFLAVYFAIPRIFFAIEADPARRPTLGRFLEKGIETATGRSSGKDALIQMLAVPVLVTLGLTAIGIIAAFYIT